MWGSGAVGVLGYFTGYFDPASSSALAFATTIHVALALLRKERSFPAGRARLILLPSFAFCAAPWLLQSPIGLAIGLASHLAWFVACEKLLPVAAPAGRPSATELRPAAPPAAATLFPDNLSARRLPAPGFVETAVLAVFEETPDIRTFRLSRPEGFEFEAGQFLSVRVAAAGRSAVRCYTISSSPGSRGHLEITVKRQGAVSSALHSTIRPGSVLPVRGPGGKFLYPGGDRPIVLIGGGVGITPLMSMLRHAVSCEPRRPVTLLYSVRTEADLAFRRELALLEARNPQLRVVVAVTRGSESPEFFPGRIDESLLREVVAEPPRPLYFLCGPVPMIAEMRRLLTAAGVPEAQVHSEAFEAAVAWASSAARPAARPAAVGFGGSGSPGATGSARLELSRSRKVVVVSPGQTLLEAAEEAGATIDSSCRSGSCGTCRTRLLRGRIGGEEGCLSAEERAQGWILPCVALAKTDCVMDA